LLAKIAYAFYSISFISAVSKKLAVTGNHSVSRMLLLRGMLFPISTATWLQFISSFMRIYGVTQVSHHLLQKSLRSYVDRRWNAKYRVAKMIENYRLTRVLFDEKSLEAILTDHQVVLCELLGKKFRYQISIALAYNARREGEFGIQFNEIDSETPLARLTFLFCKDEQGRRIMMIGGLQGSPSNSPKHLIVTATRDLFGMRPKQCVLELVQYLAYAAKCKAIFAISNNNHAISGNAFAFLRHKVYADYDAFWRERGGKLTADGLYELPMLDPAAPKSASSKGKTDVRSSIIEGATRLLKA
jgi:uncharacterized protein VirK/YbjX